MVCFILVCYEGYTYNESHYLLLKQDELCYKCDSSDYLAHNLWPAPAENSGRTISGRLQRDPGLQSVRCFNINYPPSCNADARPVLRGSGCSARMLLVPLSAGCLASPRGCDLTCQSEFSGRWAQPVATCGLQPCFTLQLAVSCRTRRWGKSGQWGGGGRC